jgi:hypothetical protein
MTAMQELLKELIEVSQIGENPFIKTTVNIIIDMAENKLEKEKEQLKTSFSDGASWELYGSNITQEERAEKYYNEVFNYKVE